MHRLLPPQLSTFQSQKWEAWFYNIKVAYRDWGQAAPILYIPLILCAYPSSHLDDYLTQERYSKTILQQTNK